MLNQLGSYSINQQKHNENSTVCRHSVKSTMTCHHFIDKKRRASNHWTVIAFPRIIRGDQRSVEWISAVSLRSVFVLFLWERHVQVHWNQTHLTHATNERNPRNLIGWRLCHRLHLLCHISTPRFLSNSCPRDRLYHGSAESEETNRQQRLWFSHHPLFTRRNEVHRAAEVPPKDDASAVGRRKDGGGPIAGSFPFHRFP